MNSNNLTRRLFTTSLGFNRLISHYPSRIAMKQVIRDFKLKERHA